jgi:hypothetical protein
MKDKGALRGAFVCPAAILALLTAAAPAWAASPSIVGSVSDPVNLSGIRAVAVSGHYAYSPSYYNGELTAIDISNPARPTIVGESSPNTGVDNADFVTISSGYAYVTSKNANANNTSNDNGTGNALSIFDIHTDPTHPALVGQLSNSTSLFGAYGVAVSGHFAYVSAQGCLNGQPCPTPTVGNDVDVIDISNPSAPTAAFQVANPSSGAFANALDHADGITISGNHAYVSAAYGHAMTVISIDPTTPSNDQIVGSLIDATHLSFPNDVAVSGGYAYVADGGTGSLAVVNVSNAADPTLTAELTNSQLAGAYRVEVSGTIAYLAADGANSISAIDISNPSAPSIITSVIDGSHLNHTSGLDFTLAGRYVIASSPFLSTEAQTNFPPYPLQPGGPTNTGTISVIDMDPNPVSVTITSPTNGATVKQGQSVHASYSCTPGGFVPVTSCTGPVASGTAINTSTPGSHTFTVTGTDQYGQTGTASVTYTVTAPHVVKPAPTIAHLHEKNRRWREHGKASRHKPPIGTTFTFTLNENARITLTFTRIIGAGRKVGKRCVVPSKKNHHDRSCQRTSSAGKLSVSGKQGANRIAFRGKIRSKFLKPGSYKVTITVTANGKSVTKTLRFTIVA